MKIFYPAEEDLYSNSIDYHESTDPNDIDDIDLNAPPSLAATIQEATDDFCRDLSRNKEYDLSKLASQLLYLTNIAIDIANSDRIRRQESPLARIKKLIHSQIAALIIATHYVLRINFTGVADDTNETHDVLGIYVASGNNEGIYVTNPDVISRLALQMDYTLKDADLREVNRRIYLSVAVAERTLDPDLIAVQNGIFDYRSKTLNAFDPNYVFLSKISVKYNPAAKPVYITEPDGSIWDVDSWIDSLFDEPNMGSFLWEIISAVIRPFNRWGRMIWFYAESGNNGKGTIVQLLRNILGGAATAITLSQFSDRFGLGRIMGKTAVLTDENNVAEKIGDVTNLKSAVTGDVIPVERKYKDIIDYRFMGLIINCINAKVEFKDKTDSFYRRVIIVNFDHSFTGGEKKYIKDDYINRQDVLEYVVYKALNSNFYEFNIPDASKTALEMFKEDNDPIRQFITDILPETKWDFLPNPFLYALYKSWCRKNQAAGLIEGKNVFISRLKAICSSSDIGLEYRDTMRIKGLMEGPEHLIAEYELQEWYNRNYVGHDINNICTPTLKDTYRGFLITSKTNPSDDESAG